MTLQQIGLLLGLAIPLVTFVFVDIGDAPETGAMASVAMMMSIFWITEAIPLAATALLPLALFPLLGIASSKAVASQYMNTTVFLLIGGFLIALAMQRWNLHKRLALTILSWFGVQPAMLLLGFILVTASLSMWISNTATTLVMLPIALAILSRYQSLLPEDLAKGFSVALLLSIAYSASIGGMMTLVGTAPNLVFARFYQASEGISVGFAQWMLFSVPIGTSLLAVLVCVMCGFCLRRVPTPEGLSNMLGQEKSQLGPMSFEEKQVFLVFLITACLWVTRKGIDVGVFAFQGWGKHLVYGHFIDDGSVAIAMALLLFLLPTQAKNGIRKKLLDEQVFSQLPWSVVVLFGGGFALAFGFSNSGLSAHLATQLQGLQNVGLPLIITAVTVGMTLLTELTSNTATTQLVLPVLQSAAEVIQVPAVMLMLPASMAASCAFMFPVATPPNAIIFSSGQVRVIDMIKAGMLFNLAAIIIIPLLSYVLIPVVFMAEPI